MQSAQPLNVIWNRTTLDLILEGYFIKEVLLAGLGRPVRTLAVEPTAPKLLMNDMLIVSFDNDMAAHLSEARTRGLRNIGLLHVGDEEGRHDRGFYDLADYVLRHYWFEQAVAPSNGQSLGVTWVPNGYCAGAGPIRPETRLGAADRTIMGFFAGALSGRTLLRERQEMVDVITKRKLPFLIFGTPGFAQGFRPVTYSAYLCNTRFALIPGGNSPETIRLYDALEAGAIPVMLKSPFVHAADALGSPPFILLDSWSELPDAYAPYADAMRPSVIAALDEKLREVSDWWLAFKRTQQDKVRNLVDRSFARSAA